MSKPVAVIISDVHYNINTLEVADKAVNMAIDKANDLDVPLIVTGDLHDTKANLRAECVSRMINTLNKCRYNPIILRGNHDSLNEKSNESALTFLQEKCFIVDLGLREYDFEGNRWYFIPYQHDSEALKQLISYIPKGSTIFCHQGVIGSTSGHYIKDNSAVPLKWFKDYRVISGHYHMRQQLFCKGPSVVNPTMPYKGVFDYIGNPFTLGFGEASDPEKGFQTLYDDGSLEFVPTNLRRHRILEFHIADCVLGEKIKHDCKENDIVWVKVTGPSDRLSVWTKEDVARWTGLKEFRLDLIPLDNKPELNHIENKETTQPEILDGLIDNLTNTEESRKLRLKDLWKKLS